jgi:hypothetical protein
VIDAGKETFVVRPRRQREVFKGGRRREPTPEGHPFAKLQELKLA